MLLTLRAAYAFAVAFFLRHSVPVLALGWLSLRGWVLCFTDFNQDVEVYFKAASAVFRGAVPYGDFALEYPPGALALFLAPRILGAEHLVYARAFATEMLLADAACVWLLWRILVRAKDRHAAAWGVVGYLFLTAQLGLMLTERFDPVVALLFLAWLDGTLRGAPRWCTDLVLATAIVCKLVLLAVVPAYLAFLVMRDQQDLLPAQRPAPVRALLVQAAARGVFLLAGVTAWLLPFRLWAGSAAWSWARYHAERGLQIESTYALVLMLLHDLLGLPLGVGFAYGAWQLDEQAPAFMLPLSSWTLAACTGLVALATVVMLLHGTEPQRLPARLVACSTAMVLIICGTAKVFSPQYLLWCAPGLALSAPLLRRWLPVTVLAALVFSLTGQLVGHYYTPLVHMELPVVALMLARNAMVLALAVLLLVQCWRGHALP